MANHLAGLQSFTVAFRDGYDVVQSSGQKIEFGETRRITLARPSQLRVEEIASDGRLDLALFDGKTITVFDADTNVFAQTPQPGTVDEALVYFVRDLRMRMPLARLLTSRLPSEWPKRVQAVDYVEVRTSTASRRTTWPAAPTRSISSTGSWTAERPLPLRVVLTYVNEPGQPQFWANFSNWNTSPKLSTDNVRIHSAAGRKQDSVRGPGSDIRRRPAARLNGTGDQAMRLRQIVMAGSLSAILITTSLFLPGSDASAARPERGGGGGGGNFSKQGPAASGSMSSQRGGGRGAGRSAQGTSGAQGRSHGATDGGSAPGAKQSQR